MYPPVDVNRILSVALVFTGDLNAKHTRQVLRDGGAKALPLWRQHVVDPVEAANGRNSVHSFVCTSRSTSLEAQPDWSILQGRRGEVIVVPEGFYWDPKFKMDQYSRMEACFLAAWGFERQAAAAWRAFEDTLDASPLVPWALQRNASRRDRDRLYVIRDAGFDPKRPSLSRRLRFQFSHYVRARPDLEFHDRIPLSAFDPQSIVLRARAVLLADECDALHHCAIVMRGGKQGYCGWKAQWREEATVGGKPHADVDLARRTMRKNGIPACGSLDDMFGVAPQHLGAAFFLRQAALEAHVPQQLLPYGWNLTQNAARIAAIQRSYGPKMSFGGFFDACKIGQVPFLSGSGSTQKALSFLASGKVEGETHMTMRTTARMLPFRFAGLPFSGPNGASHAHSAFLGFQDGNVSTGSAVYC